MSVIGVLCWTAASRAHISCYSPKLQRIPTLVGTTVNEQGEDTIIGECMVSITNISTPLQL